MIQLNITFVSTAVVDTWPVARYGEIYHPTYMDADKTKMLMIKELDQGASYFQNGKVQYTQFQLEFN